MIFIDLGELLDSRSRFTGSRQVTLLFHRRCVCHLLNLVSKADVEKIIDEAFNSLRMNVEDKLDILWNKQTSSSNNSDTIKRHLGQLFVLKNDTRWTTRYYATACVVRLIPKKEKALRKLMEEFKIPYFSPSEEQYMKEYVKNAVCCRRTKDSTRRKECRFRLSSTNLNGSKIQSTIAARSPERCSLPTTHRWFFYFNQYSVLPNLIFKFLW